MENKRLYFDNLGFAYEDSRECHTYDSLTEFELCKGEYDGGWWMYRYLLPSVIQDPNSLELILRLEQFGDTADILFRVCIRLTDNGFSFEVFEKHSAFLYKDDPEEPSINPDGFTFQWVYNDDASLMLEWYSNANLNKELTNDTIIGIGKHLAEITYHHRTPYNDCETWSQD